MAANDEIIKLLLDLGRSSANVQEVIDKLQGLQAASKGAAEGYDVLDRRTGTYTLTTAQVTSAEDKAVEAALEQTRSQKALQGALEETAKASTKAGSKVSGMGQSMLQTGRVVQDFTQGGIGGILNNLEGLSMALGGGPGLAGVLTAVGVAAFVAGPHLKTLWAGLAGGATEKIPGATDAIDKYTEAIRRNKDELEELRKKQELSLMEGIKYRDLVAETTALEEAQANARAARSVGIYDNKADRARASAFREALGEFGGGDKLVESMVAAGLPRKEAEARVADALKGDKIQIANVMNRSADFKPFYTSPEEAARKAAREKKDEADDRRNARLTEQNLARNRRMVQEAERVDALQAKEAEKAAKDRDAKRAKDAPQRAKDEAHSRLMQQETAVRLQRQLNDPNYLNTTAPGIIAAQQKWLQGLQKQLGKDFPDIIGQTLNNQVDIARNMANLTNLAAQSKRVQRILQDVTTQTRQTAANSGRN
jgi:hypothetical protein